LSATLKNKHLAGAPVAGITLAIALLAAMLVLLFPGRAEAQEEEQQQATNNAQTTTTTVQPGESLWTMAQARLAPDPAPQRVALEAERIYALNQDRIGPDPDLIIAGKELLVPSANEPATGEVGATSQPASPRPASPEPATVRPEEEIPASAAATTVEEAPAPAAELPVLPEAERSFTVREIVPQASTLISPFSDLSDTERRRVLGVGILFLTLVLALLMAWRLPLSRTVGSSSWGSYGGAYGAGRAYDDDYSRNYALSEQPAKDLSGREGTSVGQESASPEETVEEKPEPADERVAGVGGTTEARDEEDDPTDVPQREHLRLVEENPTDGQDQHHEQRRARGGR
jgi:hypothetical protein